MARLRPTSALTRALGACGLALALSTPAAYAPVAAAQGLADVATGVDLSAPVVVPAGETTTVDIGVPLGLNTSQDGFTFVSQGTSVSVTAPSSGGTTVVPVSYGGYSASITVVAEQGATGASVDGTSVDELTGGAAGSAYTTDTAPAAGSGAGEAPSPRPSRVAALALDTSAAAHVDLVGTISGNTLSVQLGVTQALNLYNQFGGTDPGSVDVRYVDGDGQLIEGVERTIDKGSRSLTLTYPVGQTPDNPFIIQVTNASDGSAVAEVTITSPGQLTTKAGGVATVTPAKATSNAKLMGMAAVGFVGFLFVLGLVTSLVASLRRRR